MNILHRCRKRIGFSRLFGMLLCSQQELKIYGADMAGTAPALAYCDYVRRVVAMKDQGIYRIFDICMLIKTIF